MVLSPLTLVATKSNSLVVGLGFIFIERELKLADDLHKTALVGIRQERATIPVKPLTIFQIFSYFS